jgi:hypothetical protein
MTIIKLQNHQLLLLIVLGWMWVTANPNSGNSILASMYDTPQALSPCLRVLIEILLNEANTRHGEVSAVTTINWGMPKGGNLTLSDPLRPHLEGLQM